MTEKGRENKSRFFYFPNGAPFGGFAPVCLMQILLRGFFIVKVYYGKSSKREWAYPYRQRSC